jgi:hypothetical protein
VPAIDPVQFHFCLAKKTLKRFVYVWFFRHLLEKCGASVTVIGSCHHMDIDIFLFYDFSAEFADQFIFGCSATVPGSDHAECSYSI